MQVGGLFSPLPWMMRQRVVITGMGVLAANGIGLDAFWESLLAGQSGIAPITLFDAGEFPVRIAGEVKGFDLRHFTEATVKPRRLGRHTQLAIAALQMAVRDAGLTREILRRHAPLFLHVGVSTSAIEVIERGKDQLSTRGPKRVSSYIVTGCQPNAIASELSQWLDVQTAVETFSTACAAGISAIQAGYHLIVSGRTDLVIAGGADAPITPLTVASFAATGMLPDDQTSPATISRPFDLRRCGGVLAEGAVFLVMERVEHALMRGAPVRLEVVGHGAAVDAPGTEPASGLEQAMCAALEEAGMAPARVDYVCAHAPSDTVIDRVETAAIRRVLGEGAYRIPVSSIKGVTGNPLAAAGPMELATCALAFRDGVVPPTANYRERDPDCDLDYVPDRPRRARLNAALLNVHGLGGTNASLAVRRFLPA